MGAETSNGNGGGVVGVIVKVTVGLMVVAGGALGKSVIEHGQAISAIHVHIASQREQFDRIERKLDHLMETARKP